MKNGAHGRVPRRPRRRPRRRSAAARTGGAPRGHFLGARPSARPIIIGMWKPALLSTLPHPQTFSATVSEPRAGAASLAGAHTSSTHFPEGLLVNGDLHSEEDVVIDGIVSGTIDMPGNA